MTYAEKLAQDEAYKEYENILPNNLKQAKMVSLKSAMKKARSGII